MEGAAEWYDQQSVPTNRHDSQKPAMQTETDALALPCAGAGCDT